MSDPAPPLSEARRRADARKAKIQARGADRLAKLASTARGDAGAELYPAAPPAPRPTPAPTTAPSTSLVPIPSPAAAADDDAENPFGSSAADSLFPGFPPAAAAGAPADDPFAAMLQAMQAAGGAGGLPPGFGGAGGEGADDPFAAMSSLFGAAAGGGGAPGFAQELQAPPPGAKTRLDKLFELAHVLGVLALVACVCRWWEPAALARRAASGFERDGGSGLAGSTVELPVFWAFVTVSLILQTSRALLFRARPPPSKLLSLARPFLPLLPPNLRTYLLTASRYGSVLSQFAQDLGLLVFALGAARWAAGGGAGVALGEGGSVSPVPGAA